MSPTAIVYFVVDVLAVIWTLEWPTHGTVATFISGFKMWLSLQLSEADVCVLTGITTTPSKVAVDLLCPPCHTDMVDIASATDTPLPAQELHQQGTAERAYL